MHKVELGGAPETLLITRYAKAKESELRYRFGPSCWLDGRYGPRLLY